MAYAYGGNYTSRGGVRRHHSMDTHHVRVYLSSLCSSPDFVIINALKNTSAEEVVRFAVQQIALGRPQQFELAETFVSGGQLCKERRLDNSDNPVRIQLLWPKEPSYTVNDIYRTEYRFHLRKKDDSVPPGQWNELQNASHANSILSSLTADREHKEYPDLCNLPELNETTLLDNLKQRFLTERIYTCIGSILIAVNPFKFYCIYNPKYVMDYQRHRFGELPPHIFAIVGAAYHQMLRERKSQCIVISGESGSGKTESTNLILNQLSALSQKGSFGSGIEQTILGAGPVLEAFGNAKTVHNNNSSRFGKFIQVNYKENGIVHGAVFEKYLLEKSRIVYQARNERNYHIFYYLFIGLPEKTKAALALTNPEEFLYLSQSQCYTIEDPNGDIVDENAEFSRVQQGMEVIGFSKAIQSRMFSVLAAVLHLGNLKFETSKGRSYHEVVHISNMATLELVSSLLKVKESTLLDALTKKKTLAGGETVVINYNLSDAIATRDAMAKCLYESLFNWIVLQINQALLVRKDYSEHKGPSIGVLDIFGFEDFGCNSFEQFCINYANENLQYYFNQHVFKYEQEEYVKEGIQWQNIEFIDNTECLDLIAKKPTGLLHLLDEECNFPGATNETLLTKITTVHKTNEYFERPQLRENAFLITHYAGKVKYQIKDFREKNLDLMRHDLIIVLKNSQQAFVRELVGYDPVAVLRWAVVRAFFRCYFAFINSGKDLRRRGGDRITSVNRTESLKQRMEYISLYKMYEREWRDETLDAGDDRKENKALVVELNQLNKNLGLTEEEFSVLRSANLLVAKNKSVKPRSRSFKHLRDVKRMKTAVGTHVTSVPAGQRTLKKVKIKQPSVSAQFSQSLLRLLDTLSHATPFFVRCIKSNSDRKPCYFDDQVVLRQLRYTGMLATVKIRQSGYNYRVTFKDFARQYRLLLPRGMDSGMDDIRVFLSDKGFDQKDFQIGHTKVFLREKQKVNLDYQLHQSIMDCIETLQRYIRAHHERLKFLRLRAATISLQSYIRGYLARLNYDYMQENAAALMVQKTLKAYVCRKRFLQQKQAAVVLQKHARRVLAVKRYQKLQRSHKLQKINETDEEEEDHDGTILFEEQSDVQVIDRGDIKVKANTSFSSDDESSDDDEDFVYPSNKQSVDSVVLRPNTLNPPPLLRTVEPLRHLPSEEISLSTTAFEDTFSAIQPTQPLYSLVDTKGPLIKQSYSPVEPSSPVKVVNPEATLSTSVGTKLSEPVLCPLLQIEPPLPEKPVELRTPGRPVPNIQKVPSTTATSSQKVEFRLSSLESLDKDIPAFSASEDEELEIERYEDSPPVIESPAGDRTLLADSQFSSELTLIGDSQSASQSTMLTGDQSPNLYHYSNTMLWDSARSHDTYETTVSMPESFSPTPGRKDSGGMSINAEDIFCKAKEKISLEAEDVKKQIAVANSPLKDKSRSTSQLMDEQAKKKADKRGTGALTRGGRIVNQQKLNRDDGLRKVLPRSAQKVTVKDQGDGGLLTKPPVNKWTPPPVKHSGGSRRPSSEQPSPPKLMCQIIIHRAKAVSHDNLVSNKPSKHEINPIGGAPLARQESLDAPLDKGDRGIIEVRQISMSDEPNRLSFSMPGQKIQTVGNTTDVQEKIPTSPGGGFMRRFHNILPGGKHRKKSDDGESDSDNDSTKAASKEAWPEPMAGKKKGRKPYTSIKKRRASVGSATEQPKTTWNVAGITQQQYSLAKVIGSEECMDKFTYYLTRKLQDLQPSVLKRSHFDTVFINALKEFRNGLYATRATFAETNRPHLTQRDLMLQFEQALEATITQHNTNNEDMTTLMTLGTQALIGFLNEFERKKTSKELPEVKKAPVNKTKKKDHDKNQMRDKGGHRYVSTKFSVHTECEMCHSAIWVMMDKGYVCQLCQYTVHKKCLAKSTLQCRGHKVIKRKLGQVFGVSLEELEEEGRKTPRFLEQLLSTIEKRGLYTTGLYRKAGGQAQMRVIVKDINAHPDTVMFEDEPIHALASIVKQFLRELPEPLLTFDLYDEFIQAAEIADNGEREQCLLLILSKLPTAHYHVTQRLIYHLARVAQHEPHNKMNASTLAIVFAPSLLKSNKSMQVQECLKHVPKQALCLQTVIQSKLESLDKRLTDIGNLDNAAAIAENRLSTIRSSVRHSQILEAAALLPLQADSAANSLDSESDLLSQQLLTMFDQKNEMTLQLAELGGRMSSSDDDVLDDDLESTEDELDSAWHEPAEAAMTTVNQAALTSLSGNEQLQRAHKRGQDRKHLRKESNSRSNGNNQPSPGGASLPLPELQQVGDGFYV